VCLNEEIKFQSLRMYLGISRGVRKEMDAFLEIHESDYSLLEDETKSRSVPRSSRTIFFTILQRGVNPEIGSSP